MGLALRAAAAGAGAAPCRALARACPATRLNRLPPLPSSLPPQPTNACSVLCLAYRDISMPAEVVDAGAAGQPLGDDAWATLGDEGSGAGSDEGSDGGDGGGRRAGKRAYAPASRLARRPPSSGSDEWGRMDAGSLNAILSRCAACPAWLPLPATGCLLRPCCDRLALLACAPPTLPAPISSLCNPQLQRRGCHALGRVAAAGRQPRVRAHAGAPLSCAFRAAVVAHAACFGCLLLAACCAPPSLASVPGPRLPAWLSAALRPGPVALPALSAHPPAAGGGRD